MAQPQRRVPGAYPLQSASPFEAPQSAPSTYSQPTTNPSSPLGSSRGSREMPWPSSSYPLQVIPRESTQQKHEHPPGIPSSPVSAISPSARAPRAFQAKAPSGSYPLQSIPVRNNAYPTTSTPQVAVAAAAAGNPAPSAVRSVSVAPQRQNTNERQFRSLDRKPNKHRTLSQSYPLQARPSQVFRDDMDLSPRAQANATVTSGTDAMVSRHPTPAIKSPARKGYYGAQVMPTPQSSHPGSSQSLQYVLALPAGQSNLAPTTSPHIKRVSQEPPRPPTSPYQMSPPPLPRADEKLAANTNSWGQAATKRSQHHQARAPPTPPSESSDETAMGSGRASRERLKRRHPYPFQEIPADSPKSNGSMESASENKESRIPSPAKDLLGGLPRLPRNIRALKDGKNSKLLGRTIVICLDGTGDKFDSDNSNIVHLVSCLKKSDASQITYYQSGIGTYDGGGLSNGLNAALDMAVGSGLGVHVRDAYHFLMQNYIEGDRICLFGFSRGAYTARCLAGMVHKVGLLPAHNTQQLPFAYEYYKDDTETGWEMSVDFKRTFCMDVSVHFIGVFDSVASVGIIPRTLPLSATPWNKATHFRHALALDEHRAKFKAKHFEQKDSIGPDAQWATLADSRDGDGKVDTDTGKRASNKPKFDVSETAADGHSIEADLYLRQKRELAQSKQTDVLEVWFAGAHADVGGGAEKNTVRHKLAQIPLRWMLRQCFECDTGIIFKVHRLAEEGLDIHTLWPTYTSLGIPRMGPSPSLLEKHEHGKIAPICRRSSVLQPVDKDNPQGHHDVVLWRDPEKRHLQDDWVPEHVEDYFDSISRVNDQLVGATVWWLLELWPIKVRVQDSSSEAWVKRVSMNLGRYRAVQDQAPNLHWTVQRRIEAMGYKVNVRMGRGACWNLVA